MDQIPEQPLRFLLGYRTRGPRPPRPGPAYTYRGIGDRRVRRLLLVATAITSTGVLGAFVFDALTLQAYGSQVSLSTAAGWITCASLLALGVMVAVSGWAWAAVHVANLTVRRRARRFSLLLTGWALLASGMVAWGVGIMFALGSADIPHFVDWPMGGLAVIATGVALLALVVATVVPAGTTPAAQEPPRPDFPVPPPPAPGGA